MTTRKPATVNTKAGFSSSYNISMKAKTDSRTAPGAAYCAFLIAQQVLFEGCMSLGRSRGVRSLLLCRACERRTRFVLECVKCLMRKGLDPNVRLVPDGGWAKKREAENNENEKVLIVL